MDHIVVEMVADRVELVELVQLVLELDIQAVEELAEQEYMEFELEFVLQAVVDNLMEDILH